VKPVRESSEETLILAAAMSSFAAGAAIADACKRLPPKTSSPGAALNSRTTKLRNGCTSRLRGKSDQGKIIGRCQEQTYQEVRCSYGRELIFHCPHLLRIGSPTFRLSFESGVLGKPATF
jgi:hypothetical protein